MIKGMVSVIVPTHDYGAYIASAVDSVLDQSHENLEVIVIDDGSHDATHAVLAHYGALERFHYWRQERGGVSAARNRGIGHARGEYLSFLDADDRWPQGDMLARAVNYLDENPRVGWIFGDAQPFDENGIVDAPYLLKGGYYERFSNEPRICSLSPRNLCNNDRFFIPTGTIVMRRSCVEQVGLFDTTLSMFEDTDMWLRLIRFPVAFVPQVLLARRVHEHNASNERWVYLPDLKRLIERYHLEEHGVSYAFHAARGHYFAGRHWLNVKEYRQARSAFVTALRYRMTFRSAAFLMLALIAACWPLPEARHANGAHE